MRATPEEQQKLHKLLPLRHLSDTEFAALVREFDVDLLDPGETLFRQDSDNQRLFFLLDGTVRVFDADGESFEITAGSIEALHPLSPHPRARIRAVATSALHYAALPAALVQTRRSVASGIEVEEVEEEAQTVDNEMLLAIYTALRDGTLVLPTLPDIALRIRAAAADPRKGAADIARIILADPALASYCIKVANSAGYAGGAPVTDVTTAVMRMGIGVTRDFIMGHVIRNLFRAKDPRCQVLMRSAWTHSANIAALSFVIARQLTELNPERALLAGLLHDVGVIVLISQLEQFQEIFATRATLRAALRDLRFEITSLVLRAWKLPEDLVSAACVAEEWSEKPAVNFGFGEVLLLAHWHDEETRLPWARPRPALGAPVLNVLPATLFTEGRHLQFVREASEELARLRALLSGN